MSIMRNLYLGFVRLHILHHAAEEPVYGVWLIDELGRHGYELSYGTLYPILHALRDEGLLAVKSETVDGKQRKYYTATEAGRVALAEARIKLQELAGEVLQDEQHPVDMEGDRIPQQGRSATKSG